MGYLFAVLTIALYVLYIGLLLRMMFDWVRIFSPRGAHAGQCWSWLLRCTG